MQNQKGNSLFFAMELVSKNENCLFNVVWGKIVGNYEDIAE